MTKFIDKNSKLYSRYEISKLIAKHNDQIILTVPHGFDSHIFFLFQGKRYSFQEALDRLASHNPKAEIFPGIYFENKSPLNIIEIIKKNIFKTDFYYIINENKKDKFNICSDLEEDSNITIIPTPETYTKLEYITPQLVEQPINLGGGKCGGCNVYSFFSAIGLFSFSDSIYDEYCFFSDKHVLEVTKNSNFFLNLCKHNKCMDTYNKIISEGFSATLASSDQINITYKNGKYFAEEGKHRICAMKRFGYDKDVPAVITRYLDNDSDNPPFIFPLLYRGDMNSVMESCYKTYAKIGISEADVKRLLNTPQATVLDYLNASKYSLNELYEMFL